VGWSDPGDHFGHGTVSKDGVAPAQQGVLPASKLIVAPCATSCSLEHLRDRQGDREGDAYGDLCLSCTLHLPALQVAIKAL
jgi:hypothetical protein